VWLLIYLIYTLGLIVIWAFGDIETKINALFIYLFAPQISFVFFLYVSLRNLKTYIIWFCVGLIHLTLFFLLKDNAAFGTKGNPAVIGINTIIVLVLFQGLRFISIKAQRREFVNPAKAMNGKDLIENRKVSALDYVISIVYFLALMGISCLSVVYF